MPSEITIIGLGPGDSRHWTRAAHALIMKASELYLRTANHPSVEEIPAQTVDFDHLYGRRDAVGSRPADSVDFGSVANEIAAEVVRLGQRDTGVIYAVPGHPAVGEATVPRILALAEAHHLPVTIVPGLSLIEPALTALKLDGLDKLQIVDALEISQRHHPPLETDRPALVTHLFPQTITPPIKQVLLNAYPDDLSVKLVQGAGTESERVWSCPLVDLDHQPRPDRLTTLYLPPAASASSFSTLQETVAHLRAPDGCPWDREQTHQSLRPYLLEETYEVLEALDAGDPEALAEEMGDLLLQVVLHTQIATEHGEFKMGDVINHINQKLRRRHPHVFGDLLVNGVGEVITNWEAIKKAEKASKTKTDPQGQEDQTPSALDGVPPGLPALAQALAISKRAVRVGFEWPNIEGVLEKLIEEAREITEATDKRHLESEIGDLLFSAVNLARWRDIDPESALRSTNARFTRRFQKLEALAEAQGKQLPDMSIEELDALWQEAKRTEG